MAEPDGAAVTAVADYLRNLLLGASGYRLLPDAAEDVAREVLRVAYEANVQVILGQPPQRPRPRLIVTGSRDSECPHLVPDILRLFAPEVIMVHGANYQRETSVDRIVHEWWTGHGRRDEPHPADWDRYRRASGKNPAGMIRNEEMARGPADACLALPGGSGTANMVERAHAHDLPVLKVEP